MLKDRMEQLKKDGLEKSHAYKTTENQFNELMSSMPKYHAHVWREHGL
jgi:hypothetical protein